MRKRKQRWNTTEPRTGVEVLKDALLPMGLNERKKTITLFMIIVFSLLLTMSAYIENWFMKIWFQIILFIAQLVIVNAILTDYYGR